METVIYTAFPCLIKSREGEMELNPNEHMTIESQNFWVEPVHGEPFEVDCEKEGAKYRISQKGNQKLIFLLKGFLSENITCHDFNYEGKKSRVEIGTNKIVFYGEKDKKVVKFDSKINFLKTGNLLFINYVIFEDGGQKCLIAYNTLKNTAKSFFADEINVENNQIKLIKSEFNYDKIEENYFVDKEGLKIKDRIFVSSNVGSLNVETTAYKFMCAIKCGDYDSAMTMLTPSLKNSLSATSLKNYFGNISYFYMLDYYSCFAISNNKNIIYEFQLSSNKIADISDNLD